MQTGAKYTQSKEFECNNKGIQTFSKIFPNPVSKIFEILFELLETFDSLDIARCRVRPRFV